MGFVIPQAFKCEEQNMPHHRENYAKLTCGFLCSISYCKVGDLFF